MKCIEGTTLYLKTIDQERYVSEVIKTEPSTLYIRYPIHEETNKLAFFIDDTKFIASFTEEHNRDITYEFHTFVNGRQKGDIPLLSLHYPGNEQLEKIEQQKYVEIFTQLDVSIQKMTKYYPIVTENLSAAGFTCRLTNDLQLKKDDEVRCVIVLPFTQRETAYIQVGGKVVMQDDTFTYIEYIDITPANRQQMLQFIFERQLDQRRIE